MVALAGTIGLLSGPADAAVGEHEGAVVHGDFDGDGEQDVVVSSPQHSCGRGIIHIRSGTSVSSWTRATTGVLGIAACNQYFGTALASGDFDDDGYDDLAVSAPGAADSGLARSGSVHVFYGSSTGLSLAGDQLWHQDTTGIKGVAEVDDYVGDALEVGDFNCDGYDDIVIGVPREDLNAGQDAGATHVLYGSSGGVSTVDDWWHTGVSGVNGLVEPDDHFGGALAAGNFNGDSSSGRPCDDLAIASPGEGLGSLAAAGQIYIMDGSASGLSTTGDQVFNQDVANVEGTAEADDRFGERLLAHDINGDGFCDLYVSVPGDSSLADHGEGRHFFPGGSFGLRTTDDELTSHDFHCQIDPAGDSYGCRSYADDVYASGNADRIDMFVGSGVVWAGDGADSLTASLGDDVFFGGPGDDVLLAGPGADFQIGGSGDDTFVLNVTCEAESGEVIDGGPGNDTVESHLDRAGLLALGVTFNSVENFVTVAEGGGHCSRFPYEEGRFLRPAISISWDDLPEDSSEFSTKTGLVDLTLQNHTATDLDVQLRILLLVRGNVVPLHPAAISVPGVQAVIHGFDLNDFIPAGTSAGGQPAPLLELPVSASVLIHGRISHLGEYVGSVSAPEVYGHVESGTTAVLYRAGLLGSRYHGGDLLSWRAKQVPLDPGRVQVAAVVPDSP